jgi:hypothetical protein
MMWIAIGFVSVSVSALIANAAATVPPYILPNQFLSMQASLVFGPCQTVSPVE